MECVLGLSVLLVERELYITNVHSVQCNAIIKSYLIISVNYVTLISFICGFMCALVLNYTLRYHCYETNPLPLQTWAQNIDVILTNYASALTNLCLCHNGSFYKKKS